MNSLGTARCFLGADHPREALRLVHDLIEAVRADHLPDTRPPSWTTSFRRFMVSSLWHRMPDNISSMASLQAGPIGQVSHAVFSHGGRPANLSGDPKDPARAEPERQITAKSQYDSRRRLGPR